ncbi:carboxypeptidase B [Drosophila elegans]|uniref:carboxypeptidase B n=1 Tax=Drosophila elegans TaxID=30023 RepID=UPI0007E65547|nr:carboxypeptidase B [Drosophila elegans]
MWRPLCAIVFLVVIVSPLAETSSIRRRKSIRLPLSDYLNYDGVMSYLDRLAIAHSDRVTLKEVGRSYENRALKLVMITNGDGRQGKRVIFLDAALHAREWMTPAVALYAINKLVVEFEENAHLLADFDWHIMPLANPDGYEYSRNKDRYWRNTRKPNGGGCFGTNLNRNFEVGWAEGFPELKDPCDENYAGNEPFSEVEARTVRDIMHSLVESERAVMYLSLHTANRSVFYPWVYEYTPVPNQGEHDEIAKYVADQIFQSTGTVIKPRQAAQYAGTFGGTSMDYAYKVGFPLSFVFEMSGTGGDHVEYKFFPPTWDIRRLADESWTGIRAFGEKVIEMYPPSRQLKPSQIQRLTGSASRNWGLSSMVGTTTFLLVYFTNNFESL